MRASDFYRIKSINVDQCFEEADYSAGTFREILEAVYTGKIRPLVNNWGNVVGISYDAGSHDMVEDNIAQRIFERRYAGKPVMKWAEEAFKLYEAWVDISQVQEDGDEIAVIARDGERIQISGYGPKPYRQDPELPETVDISANEISAVEDKEIKKYLRNTYNHYLAKGCNICYESATKDNLDYIHVSDIRWGRKLDK